VLRLSEHLSAENGEAMFRLACAMGLEGIVSKPPREPLQVRLVQELAEGQEPGLLSRRARDREGKIIEPMTLVLLLLIAVALAFSATRLGAQR
jgi:hypothetical protein